MHALQGAEAGSLEIAGFWRRIVALAIDATALGFVGTILGAFFFDPLAQMGACARLIGFAIALTYFGVGNSRITGGQTLGKRLLRIRVVAADSRSLSLPRSLVRCVVLVVPFFLNGLWLDAKSVPTLLGYLLALVFFGGLPAIVYLYLFNRRTRQSLHDLAVGSYVVPAEATEQASSFPRLWHGHLGVVAILAVAALGAPALLQRFAAGQDWKDLTAMQRALSGRPHVMQAQVVRGWTLSAGKETRYLQSLLRLDAPLVDDSAFAQDVARQMVDAASEPITEDTVTVTLVHGYDMGIASMWKKHSYVFKSGELQ